MPAISARAVIELNFAARLAMHFSEIDHHPTPDLSCENFGRGKENPAQGVGRRADPVLSRAATATAPKHMDAATSLRLACRSPISSYSWIRHLKFGVLDHVPADLPVAPKLVEHYHRVKNDARVQAYCARLRFYGLSACIASTSPRTLTAHHERSRGAPALGAADAQPVVDTSEA